MRSPQVRGVPRYEVSPGMMGPRYEGSPGMRGPLASGVPRYDGFPGIKGHQALGVTRLRGLFFKVQQQQSFLSWRLGLVLSRETGGGGKRTGIPCRRGAGKGRESISNSPIPDIF